VSFAPDDLQRFTTAGEGARLEFKRILPRAERAARTLCAFANTRGGLLIVGVTDRGRVHGVHAPERIRARIEDLARTAVAPALAVRTQVLAVDGPRVVLCTVPRSRTGPHAVLLPRGEARIFVRIGASNRIADGPALEALHRNRREHGSPSALEKEILAWVRARRRARARPSGDATAEGFARERNVGLARARRAFVRLERRGRLVGHGPGRARVYTAP